MMVGVFVARICRDDKKKWRDYISIAKRTKRTKWRIVSLVVEQFYDRVPGLKRWYFCANFTYDWWDTANNAQSYIEVAKDTTVRCIQNEQPRTRTAHRAATQEESNTIGLFLIMYRFLIFFLSLFSFFFSLFFLSFSFLYDPCEKCRLVVNRPFSALFRGTKHRLNSNSFVRPFFIRCLAVYLRTFHSVESKWKI